MAADCCSGTLHTGTPLGRVETLHNLPCYISDPPNGAQAKGVVVIIPDAFGWELPNSRVLADNYAKRAGVRVLLPDFMDGWSPFSPRTMRSRMEEQRVERKRVEHSKCAMVVC